MGETCDASSPGGPGGIEKLDLVVKSIKRTRNKLGCGFLLLVAIGIGFIVGGVVSEEKGTVAITIVGVVCLLLSAVGVKIILPILKPAESPLVRLLLEHPENVAWIYTAVDPGSGGVYGKSKNVTVNDTDKKSHTFSVKEKDLEEVLETLKSFAPRAAVGMTDEIRKKYFQDPWSVMSDS